MAEGSAGKHVIDIIIDAADNTGGGLKSAQEKILRFDRAVQKTQTRMRQMANQSFRVTLDAIDKVTPQGTRINSFLRRMTGKAYRLTVGLIDRTTAGIRSIEARLARVTSKAYNITMNLRGSAARGLRSMADSALGAATGMTMNMAAGAGIGYGIYDTVQTYRNFEQQMGAVGAIRGLDRSSEAMQALTEKAKEMGAKTVFSATQSGKAFEYMAMAGWDTEQMLGGIEGIMNLAAASGEDLGRVSDIVTDALTAFGMKAEESGKFADVLAIAASNSNTNVGMMGETFKYAAPLAGALKYSIEDVALATGLMANAGIKGEQAGTALRSTFTRLVEPPKAAAEAIAKMNLRVKNTDGSMRPLRAVLKDLRTAFAEMTDAEKAANAEAIAGHYAMSGFLAMMNAAEEDVTKLTAAVDDAAGAAEKMAKLRLDNLSGDLTLLGSAWESMQISLMEGTGAEGLRSLVQGVTKDVEKLHGYIKKGFGFKEAGQFALDIIGQLTNKFREMDGIGSLLAGGALATGLYKIASLAQKASRALQAAGAGPSIGRSIPGVGGGALSGMTVSANSVIVNGGSVAGGTPTGGAAGQQQTPAPGGGGFQTWGRGWGLAGAVMGGVMGVADFRSTQEYNDRMLEEADWRIHLAKESGDDTEYANALDYKAAVEAQNLERELTSGGAAIGGVIGGGIGAYLSGPAGMAIGTELGQFIGAAFGKSLADRPDEMKKEIYETGSVDGPAVRPWNEMEPVSVDPETGKVSGGPASVLQDIPQEEIDAWEPIDEMIAEQTSAAWNTLWSGMVEDAAENIRAAQSELDAFNTAAQDTAKQSADAMRNDFIEPTKAANMEAAAVMREESVGAFEAIKAAGSGLAEWFMSLFSFGGGRSEAVPHAAGGIFSSPHIGLVAEDGPEAIIPLGAGQRDRAVGIFEQIAPMLGFGSTDEGGVVASMSMPTGGNGGAPAITINLGGLSQSITVSGENASSTEAIKNYLMENMEQMADQLAGMISEKVGDSWNNQALVTG